MGRFDDQVAIITGGASGIGAGIAERLAREGALVALFDTNQRELLKKARSIKKEGLKVDAFVVDVTSDSQVQSAVEEVVDRHSRLDIMVNSAGVVGPSSTKILDYSADDFRRVVDVNLTGSFLMTKHAIRPMVNQEYGRILLLASIGGKEGNPGMVGYAASKSGVMGLVKAIGKEYAEMGITVNGLAPAVVATPMNADTDPEMLEYMTSKIPMNRLCSVDEVAALSCWIVSKEASFNTGFVFDISGGRATF
ncbi:MAG: SDR family oxidoreductase [Rhodothermaceae bacterium]|nr:SDR family oxidoreductase [Rhodothermaceae bacterium]